MVDLFFTSDIRQLDQHLTLSIGLGENVSDHHGFAGFQVPDMDVMYVDDSLDFLKLLLELLDVDIGRGALHHQVVAVFDDGDR